MLDLWNSEDKNSDSKNPENKKCIFTPAMVANVLIMMSNTSENLHKNPMLNGAENLFQSEINNWNVKNFLDVVYKFNSQTLTMHSIVSAMDQPSFLIEDESQLKFIVESVNIMCEWNKNSFNKLQNSSKMPFP